ncbi:TetR/AcrR family transcriptional regulator [Microlunatus speluncae]|uniref:TetR/AcrR family transcriptional regulator n=1 Tax=Microlunatus speluncae TaxID=2594267 RepID=UPI001376215F|nr:TetR/AcrR family transcriptional regulator [Microlunatus speluncae]
MARKSTAAPEPAPSATSERTRRAIIDAAMETWSVNQTATLGDICDTAGIGRSTLHRHFADRAALLAAVDQQCQQQFTVAALRAHPDDGPGLEAVLRLCQELLEFGQVLSLIFSDNALIDPDGWDDGSRADQGLTAVIQRGRRDGTIDPELPADWIESVIWMLLFCAWQRSRDGGSRRETAALLSRSLSGAIGTRGPA